MLNSGIEHHFVDYIFTFIFLNENCILIQI